MTKQEFENVAKIYPNKIEPWQALAQMSFKEGDYSKAIVYAKHAMKVVPDDSLSNSIVSVSGLRLSARALGVLRRSNKLKGSLRSEATSLARVLRSNLEVDEVVPTEKVEPSKGEVKKVQKRTRKRSIKKRVSRGASVAKPKASGSNDPFASLE